MVVGGSPFGLDGCEWNRLLDGAGIILEFRREWEGFYLRAKLQAQALPTRARSILSASLYHHYDT
jgi:hypothetical protein